MQQKLSNIVRRGRVLAGGAVLVALASCGGSDNGGGSPPAVVTPPTSTGIPSSASASVSGFIAYLKVLTATTQDTVEPLDTTGFVAPTDDTASPDPSI